MLTRSSDLFYELFYRQNRREKAAKVLEGIAGRDDDQNAGLLFHQINAAIESCDSPIEEQMLVALAFIDGLDDEFPRILPARKRINFVKFDQEVKASSQSNFGIVAVQQPIGPYTADFCVVHKTALRADTLKIVVECDGHEFHEKTKEQAAHDKERDRFMKIAGYDVMRFTGSQIYADLPKCILEISCLVTMFSERIHKILGHNRPEHISDERWASL